MIYLDYAATTPMSENALNIYNQVSRNYYGNSSSLHDVGSNAKNLLEHCRENIANIIKAPTKGIYFTSGGAESNILSIRTLIQTSVSKGNHIVTTAMEHSSLLQYFHYLEEKHNFTFTYLDGNQDGTICLQELESAIQSNTILVSIQHANSETGVIQPIEEIGSLLRQYDVLFHSDCVQSFGKIEIDVHNMQIDSLTISSHKIYGPKGVGAVYLNPNIPWTPEMFNRKQENGFRPGTINTPGIASFTTAALDLEAHKEINYKHVESLRTQFIEKFKKDRLKGQIISCQKQLPHIIGIVFDTMQGDYAMLELNRNGFAVSTGSACSIGEEKPSKTLLSLGYTALEAKRFIRLSIGNDTEQADLDKLLDVLRNIL